MNNYLQLRARLLYATARNIFSSTNKHPLPYAAKKGHIDVVKYLVDHGVNPNTQNVWHNTALHISSQRGNLHIVKFLLASNANPNLQNESKNTALHYSVEKGDIHITNILLNHKANITIQNSFNHTPFKRCWMKYIENSEQNLEMMRLLITHIVKIERANLVDTNSPGFLQNKELISESEELNGLKQQCHKEIEEMKSIYVSKNDLSFFDIFVLKKDMNILARCVNNPDIVRHQNKFSMYSPFIEKSIEEGKARAKLLQGAAESMDEIFESNQDASQKSQTSWSHLPPEVRLMILENLGNDDLTKLQHNEEAAAEAEAQVEGAYAIYEGE
ncbi:ankyrin repeat domain-containing protein [Orientia tsutsugamushi]|uniref:Ankyrin repeat-containing protein n=1 Tax=Orientia tsutsugamushi TaxID=784 RepID=A0A2U3RS95_ORITS|nr:ankyrin repeat domain-containing protein [Orientia tsutsugamushi]SPR15948.1 ankyrin repeat-containing protein [Orientia tsutsugamushi]